MYSLSLESFVSTCNGTKKVHHRSSNVKQQQNVENYAITLYEMFVQTSTVLC